MIPPQKSHKGEQTMLKQKKFAAGLALIMALAFSTTPALAMGGGMMGGIMSGLGNMMGANKQNPPANPPASPPNPAYPNVGPGSPGYSNNPGYAPQGAVYPGGQALPAPAGSQTMGGHGCQ